MKSPGRCLWIVDDTVGYRGNATDGAGSGPEPALRANTSVYGSRARCLRLYSCEESHFISHGDRWCELGDALYFAEVHLRR